MKTLKKLLICIINLVIAGIFIFHSSIIYASNNTTSNIYASSEKIISNLIADAKKKYPKLSNGFGMKSLNTSPSISFIKKSNGKINALIEDSTSIKRITRTNTKTNTKKEIKGNKQKKQIDSFNVPTKNNKQTILYTLTDISDLTSKVTCNVTNTENQYNFDISMRESFSYSDGYLNIILRDNAGINENKVLIEIIDKNASNKSIEKVKGKNIKITNSISYKGKKVYGIYKVDINKLTKNKDKQYFIQVKIAGPTGTSGYRMAKFSLSDTETKKSDTIKNRKENQGNSEIKNNKATISTSFESYSFAEKGNTENLNAKASTGLALSYSSSNTKVASVDKNGIVKAKNGGTAKITIKAIDDASVKKTVTIRVPSANTLSQVLKPWFDAQKKQFEIVKRAPRKWISRPSIANSKKGGTCITFVACSLQRLGFIKSGQYIATWGTSGRLRKEPKNDSKQVLDNRKNIFEYKYIFKKTSSLKEDDIKIGDILCYKYGKEGHIQVYAGKNKKKQLLYNSGGRTKCWKGSNSYFNNKIISAIIRIKTYDIKASCTNGKVSGNNTYMAKQDAKITYTPDKGKKLKSLVVDGKSINIKKHPKEYTFKDITKNHTVKVVYE